jgi:DNA ligase (NAD+)
MADAPALQRAADLREELNFHNHRYYVLDDPTISDGQYDGLMAELRRLEEEYPELLIPESPTLRVGAPPAEGFTQVAHQLPMLSLGNAFDDDGVAAWHRRVQNLLDGADSGRRFGWRRRYPKPAHCPNHSPDPAGFSAPSIGGAGRSIYAHR